ncbi:hypothetical protein [Pseudomonas viridiflava]|uniref:hypothetical protein n=1 Tax=Pseudomonas syringae group TaxID=136849 RepID=UPI000F026287|nr:hypothetical protein [Pseudomonas viridiflava]MCQ9390551.1 DUF4174 domain-containing protein [Pseudomonas viridiflava]
MKQTPMFVEYGDGDKRVYVFSPVMPIWDAGEFFRPLTSFFAKKKYRVVIFDSLSILDDEPFSFSTFVHRWEQALEHWAVPDLIAGGALGGALAQALVGSTRLSGCKRLLLISAPTKSDQMLEMQLGSMIQLVNAGDVPGAKSLLDRLVIADGDITAPNAPEFCTQAFPIKVQGKRLAEGFQLLKGIDLTQALKSFQGRVLSIYGQKSQLVKRHNVCTPQDNVRVVEVPKGGMRPLTDNLPLVLGSIQEHLISTTKVGV